jgi:Leucine-rich repeat (LRR) protein
MTERLGTLSNLQYLYLLNCSLTSLPNLSGLSQLRYVSFYQNRLSKVEGLTDVSYLVLRNNLFTDIPTLNTPSRLQYLDMNHNSLKNMLAITSHINLQTLYLINTTLSSVPGTIDRLQQLQYLDLFNNKLFYLPTNILNLANLRWLDIQGNLFALEDIKALQTRFNASRPNMTVYY